jgi:hypothetical protein
MIDSGLPFGMQVDTYAEGKIGSLLQERDSLSEQIARQEKAYEELEQRVLKRAAVDADIPVEVVHRLNRLENVVERYRVENPNSRDSLKVTQNEVIEFKDEFARQ